MGTPYWGDPNAIPLRVVNLAGLGQKHSLGSMTQHPSLIHLRRDHHHGIALALRCRKRALGQVRPAGTAGLQEQVQELVDFFALHLDGHFRAEEGILFPLVARAHPNAGLLIASLVRDHEQIRGNIACLPREMNPAKLLFAVGDVLETHIRREAKELFPLVVDCLVGAEAHRVSAEIEKVAQTK